MPSAYPTDLAAAAVPQSSAGSVACQAGQFPDAGFRDIQGNAHERQINCLPRYGVAKGLTATAFGPAALVRRDQMASFLARALTELRIPLPAGGDRFDDLRGNVHRDSVERLAAAGIVNGTGQRRYSPDEPVRREQMATLLWRAYVAMNPEDSDAVGLDYFSDDDGSFHEHNINRAFDPGRPRAACSVQLVTGTKAPWIEGDELGQPYLLARGLYDPSAPVRRDQMASFMARLLDTGLFAAPGANADPYLLDEQVLVKDGWSMSVVGSDSDATLEVTAFDPVNGPPADNHRYVIIRVRATYLGPGTSTFDGYDRLRVRPSRYQVGDDLRSVQPAAHRPCGRAPFDLPNPEAPTGGTVEGNVCFELREDEYPHFPHLLDTRWGNPAWPHFEAHRSDPPAYSGERSNTGPERNPYRPTEPALHVAPV